MQAREHAVEQKTEELTVLRAEVSSLYHQLQAQLPDLHSRCLLFQSLVLGLPSMTCFAMQADNHARLSHAVQGAWTGVPRGQARLGRRCGQGSFW